MYIYIYIYIHIHTHTYIYIYIYIYTHTHMHMRRPLTLGGPPRPGAGRHQPGQRRLRYVIINC